MSRVPLGVGALEGGGGDVVKYLTYPEYCLLKVY